MRICLRSCGLSKTFVLYLGTVRYLCLRGGRCLEWGGKIFKINEKGEVFFLNTVEIREVNF